MVGLSPSMFLLATCFLFLFLVIAADDSTSTEDCNPDLTTRYQDVLNSTYPKLHEMIANQSLEAGNEQRGSFYLMNAQDKVFKLKCPCKGSYTWTLLDDDGKEAEEFNKEKYSNEEIRPRAPKPKNYFRTYKCTANDKHHYFNVFTRPLPVTTWPIQWVEDEKKDTVDREPLKFECRGKAFKGSLGGEKFKYKWILPPTTDNKLGEVLEDIEAGQEANGLKFSAEAITVKTENGEKVDASIVKSKSAGASLESAGRYECVVIDVNGLTSSFRWDKARVESDDEDIKRALGEAPNTRFAGFVDVHVRGKLFVFWPLVAFAVAVVIFVVFVFVCPVQREKFGSEDLGKEKDKSKGKGPEPEAVKSVELHPSATTASQDKKKKKRRKKKKSGVRDEGSDVVSTHPAAEA